MSQEGEEPSTQEARSGSTDRGGGQVGGGGAAAGTG